MDESSEVNTWPQGTFRWNEQWGPMIVGPCLTWWPWKPPWGRVICLFWGGFVPLKAGISLEKHQPCPFGMALIAHLPSALHPILFFQFSSTPCASTHHHPHPFALLFFKEKNLSLMCEWEGARAGPIMEVLLLALHVIQSLQAHSHTLLCLHFFPFKFTIYQPLSTSTLLSQWHDEHFLDHYRYSFWLLVTIKHSFLPRFTGSSCFISRIFLFFSIAACFVLKVCQRGFIKKVCFVCERELHSGAAICIGVEQGRRWWWMESVGIRKWRRDIEAVLRLAACLS